MVPLLQASLTRAAVDAPSRNCVSTGGGFFRQRRPLITYGKKDSKPLPLSASHFRRDTYAIALDEGENESASDNGIPRSTQRGAKAFSDAADDGDAESELSDKPADAPDNSVDD